MTKFFARAAHLLLERVDEHLEVLDASDEQRVHRLQVDLLDLFVVGEHQRVDRVLQVVRTPLDHVLELVTLGN